MNVILEVKGINRLINNLRRVHKNIGKKVESGLVKAGLHLMRESQLIVPVQLSNLKASAFVRKESPKHVIIGYEGVSYAAYVHEIPNPPHAHGKEFNIKHAAEIAAAKGTWRGTAAGGMFKRKDEEQWKYLETPIRDAVGDRSIIKIIRDEVTKTKI